MEEGTREDSLAVGDTLTPTSALPVPACGAGGSFPSHVIHTEVQIPQPAEESRRPRTQRAQWGSGAGSQVLALRLGLSLAAVGRDEG